jgi:hypothetical protein
VTPTGCTPPTAYALTGGGAYCTGGSGVSVGLANSDSGINYQLRLNGTDTGATVAGTGSALDFGLQTAAGTYTVTGSNTTTACVGLMSGNAVVTINALPAVSGGASNTVVCTGATANFTVTATGAGLAYQWQADSGSGFANVTTGTGGTSSSYTTAPLSISDNGTQYRCIVSGTCAPSATSGAGTVTVSSGVSLNSSPGDKTVSVGSIATFAVSASGPGLVYQWQVSTDGGSTYNNVSTGTGGTTSSYTTPPLALTDSGSKYQCILSAACGSPATAGPATLTVNSAIYRSVAGGVWQALSTWEQSYNGGGSWVPGTTFPTADNTTAITVRNGHVVSVTNALLVDDLVIQAGGEVDASGATITINDGANAVDCDVFGTLQVANVTNSSIAVNSGAGVTFENGGHYIWNGITAAIFPIATWADGSLCENQGGNNTTPSGLGQSFYNFYWNRTTAGAVSLSNLLTTVRHELRMHGSTDAASSVRFLSSTAVNDLSVGGDVVIEGGFVTCSGNSTPNTILNLKIGGNLVIEPGATLDSRNSGANSANNFIFTNASGTQYITNGGSIGHSGSGGGTPNNWIISNAVSVVLGSGGLFLGTANNATRDSVIVDGALSLLNNQITGPGNLVIDPSGTLVANGNSQITFGLASIQYGGTLNLGTLPALNAGDSFKVFDALAYTGAFNAIVPATPGPGLVWDTSQLTVSGTLIAALPGSGPDTTPTNLVASVSGNTLTLSWPPNHIGWFLEVQTNSLSSTWTVVPGSSTTNQVDVPIDTHLTDVFYRLRLTLP